MLQLTDAEWSVMEALWQGGQQTLGQVVQRLAAVRRWSRNTVHTYLTRMEGKGLVCILREGEPHHYRAAVSREDCAGAARSDLLQRVYGGAAGELIAAFLRESSISPQERERLRQLLDDMEV